MEGQARNEFVVDTIGHCFICIEQISPRLVSEPQSSNSSSIYSLRYLSRYLKLRLRNVFPEEEQIPEELLEKVERSTLKANLCEACASWNAKLSELCRQLEKIKLETVEHLQLIHGKLLRADKSGKSSLLNKLADHSSTSEVMGKLEIAEILRKETAIKCSQKLKSVHPRVRVNNLTEKDVLRYKKLQSSSNIKDLRNSDTERLEINEMETSVEHGESTYAYGLGEQSEGSEHADMPNMKTNGDFMGAELVTTSNPVKEKDFVKDPKTGKVNCNLCLKKFADVSSFRRHYKNVHLNIRFKCEICNKVFTDRDNLRGHQKAVHLKIKFKCNICDKAFSSKSQLTVHQRSLHPKKELN